MLKSERIAALFDEAKANSADSLSRLNDAEKHWDRRELLRSADKAWAAATQATNALVLAYTGVEPESGNGTGNGVSLHHLSREIPELKEIVNQYTGFHVYLFDLVICDGNVDPLDDTISEIRAAAAYVKDAERLAGGEGADG